MNDKDVIKFTKKYGFIGLIVIAVCLSVFMRIQPAYLPITDEWADNAIQSSIKGQIMGEIDKQYPNLPTEKKLELMKVELDKVMLEQSSAIEQQKKEVSEYFKSQAKDEDGNIYLNDIDTWVWYFYTRNLVDHGHVGDEVRDGKAWQYVPAPQGSEMNANLHIYVEYYTYKIVHVFNKDVSLMTVIFFLPLLLCALCIIPTYFIVRKKAGDFGAFVAAVVIAITPAFLSRTFAGIVDTDPYNVLFPLYITWFFLEAIYAKRMIFKIILGTLAGFTIAVFSFAWVGWWFIFDFLLGLSVVYILYLIIHDYFENKKFVIKEKTYIMAILLSVFVVTTIVFTSFVVNINVVQSIWNGPIGFIQFKQVGVDNIWPNVYTTVAEQNSSSLKDTIWNLGGNILFILSLLGILLLIFNKDEEGHYDIPYTLLLSVWFVATMYASIKGVRFILLLAPAYAIALGIAFGLIYKLLIKEAKKLNFNMTAAHIVVIILLLTVFIFPRNLMLESYEGTQKQFPMMNDAWFNALTKVKEGTPDNSIITSWWDYGHWFRAVGDRPITFDGGSQNTPMAHWVGRMFLTTDENEAVGILRMLDCGSSEGQKKLEEYMDNDTLSSVELIKQIILVDRVEAKHILEKYISPEQTTTILNLTHCNPPPAIVITSDDMIGKSGVWTHFGSWNFTKADMLNKVQKMDVDETKTYMKNKFNYTDEESISMYYKIKSVGVDENANTWIAPWLSYASEPNRCKSIDNYTLFCANDLIVNLTTMDAYFANGYRPKTFTYIYNNTVVTKTYESSVFISNDRAVGVALTVDNSTIYMDSELTGSIFNRLYYFDGVGLKHFSKFVDEKSFLGNRIVVWQINWNGE